MSNTNEQTLQWNQFWNFIAKKDHNKDEVEEGMKKVVEALSKYILEEPKSGKYFSLELDWYHAEEIPNLYRAYVRLTVYTHKPTTVNVKITKIEPEPVPLPSILTKLTGGNHPPTPPSPPGPHTFLVLNGNPVFENSIGDNQFLPRGTMGQFAL